MATIVPASLTILHESFARRMKQACDANDDIPPLNDGRLVWMQQRMANEGHEVSLQTVMRWYYGASMPRQKKLISLAKVLSVSASWLSLGRDERSVVDTSARRISTEGAVNALAGHMQMSGVPCAFPEKGDTRSDKVHFYSIIEGRQHPIHVASGIMDKKSSNVVFQVPASHSGVIVMLVLPMDQKSVEVWHIPPNVIEITGQKDSDVRTISGKINSRTLGVGRFKIVPVDDLTKALML